MINGIAIYSDASTVFREGNCKHVEDGRRVLVVGVRQPDGRIRAQRIDIKPRG